MKKGSKIYINFRSIDDENRFVKRLVHELTASNANNPNAGAIVYGFSVRIDNRQIKATLDNPSQAKIAKKEEPKKEPLIDIIDGPSTVSVLAELPGLDKRSLDIAADSSKLRISCLWSDGDYARSLNLPNTVNPKSAAATYNNGVLEITFQKSESSSNEMKIALN